MTRKIRIGLLFGGRSGEHEVSLRSALAIQRALDSSKYDVTPIGITKHGQWVIGPAAQAALTGAGNLADLPANSVEAVLPGKPHAGGLLHLTNPNTPSTVAAELDVVFPVLHGTFGEDGTLQGLLELADLPYVGAGVTASSVGMDKGVFKAVMQGAGIPVLPYQVVLRSAIETDLEAILTAAEHAFHYPVFTKPCNLGSSVGISKAENRAQLAAGLQEAARWDRRVLIEQGIPARELEISILGNDRPIASIVGEIRPRRAFYDYVAKYISDDSELLIPAPISPELAQIVQSYAIAAYKAIDGSGLARVDFLLDRDRGELYINEINTMPGFTEISMYPKLWEASGISFEELVDRLVALALERHSDRQRTERDFERTT